MKDDKMKKLLTLTAAALVSLLPALQAQDAEEAPNPDAPAKAAPAAAPKAAAPAGGQAINAPMPGTILSVNVKPGQAVKKGDVLVMLEAMKMDNEIMAPTDGTVGAVNVTKGQSVQSGDVLLTLA